METEIRAAAILFPRDTNKVRDRDYPRLQFRNGKKVKELRRVAIRSVFRFRYNPSPYQIELTIRREWPSATAMSDNTMEPITTFEIMVYGDHWGETRASEVSKTDQGWGQELEYLFRPIVDEGGNNCLDTYTNGEHKVQAMVDVVHDIRNALSS